MTARCVLRVAFTMFAACAGSPPSRRTAPDFQPAQPDSSTYLPQAPYVAPASTQVQSVVTDEYLACGTSRAGDEFCQRQRGMCDGVARCRLIAIANCFRGSTELCFEDAARCFYWRDVAIRSHDAPGDCYLVQSKAWYSSRLSSYSPAPTQVAAAPMPSVVDPGRVLLFGGHDHKTFLGCLCGEYDADSLLNEYGTYGSSFSANSIWNDFSEFGSQFSSTSACNDFASDPPVLVTSKGKFVGYLTTNEFKSGAVTDEDVVKWLHEKVCKD